MNFEFDDDFFDKPNDPKVQNNMEDILDEVDNIDWDNFGDVNENSHSLSKSNISEMFNTEKKSKKEESVSRDFEMSRDIDEISMIYASKKNESFRFELSDIRSNPQSNSRYQKLQTLLNQAKQNSLNAFYKNIQSQQNAYGSIQPKFQDYGQFKNFTKQLKYKKRQEESKQKENSRNKQAYREMEEFNPFESKNDEPMTSYGQQKQFKKKNVYESVKPSQYADFDFFAPNNENSSQKSNSYQRKEEPADVNHNLQYKFQSYNENSNKSSSQQFYDMIPQHSVRNSDHYDSYTNKQPQKPINQDDGFLSKNREQSEASFSQKQADNKFEQLLNNYKNIRHNFEGMLHELKNTNEGQEKIVEEIRKLKESRMQNQQKKEKQKRMRREEKEREKEKQNEQIREIREEVGKINSNSRDILYLKMNQKIEQLQEIVRMALKEVNEEKEQKLQPKVINYFCDRDQRNNQYQNDGSEEPEEVGFSREELHEKYDTYSQSQNQRQRVKYSKEITHSRERSYKASPKYSEQEEQSVQVISSFPERNKKSDFCSPLDLCFDKPAKIDEPIMEQIKFEPSDFAQEYFPKAIQYKNRNLKNCLTQKSSVIFQSFEFHISARFTLADDPIHPLAAVIRVGNKCSIDLIDVHTIVYGPQGPGLQTEPPKMFNEQVKKGGSFTFTVFINKECFEDNGFSLQISYKTEGINKKKVNLKVPLPLIQLIKPEFIYEQQFFDNWISFEEKQNELFIKPKLLNISNLRGHEDIKLILPFIDLTEQDPNIISYGIMFTYPKTDNLFLIKLQCYLNNKASLILRTDKNTDRKIKEQILDVLNFLLFDPSDTSDFKYTKKH